MCAFCGAQLHANNGFFLHYCILHKRNREINFAFTRRAGQGCERLKKCQLKNPFLIAKLLLLLLAFGALQSWYLHMSHFSDAMPHFLDIIFFINFSNEFLPFISRIYFRCENVRLPTRCNNILFTCGVVIPFQRTIC